MSIFEFEDKAVQRLDLLHIRPVAQKLIEPLSSKAILAFVSQSPTGEHPLDGFPVLFPPLENAVPKPLNEYGVETSDTLSGHGKRTPSYFAPSCLHPGQVISGVQMTCNSTKFPQPDFRSAAGFKCINGGEQDTP